MFALAQIEVLCKHAAFPVYVNECPAWNGADADRAGAEWPLLLIYKNIGDTVLAHGYLYEAFADLSAFI